MEMEASDLEESGMKQSKLALLWKDLLERIDSTRKEVEARFLEFLAQESQLEAKAVELQGIEKLMEGKLRDVESSKEHLRSLQSLIQEHEEELSVKEKRFLDVQRRVGEKEREYDSIEALVKDRTKRLNLVEITLEEKSKWVESKEKEVKRVRGVLHKYTDEIEVKKNRLNEIMGCFEDQKKNLALKEEKMNRSVVECDKKIKLKEERLSLFHKRIEEYSNILKSRKKEIRDLDLKVKDFGLHKRSMDEWSCKLELKEKQFESKVEELNKRISKCLNEVQLKENNFDSLEKLIQEREKQLDSQENSIQEWSGGLEMKERQLEQRAKELELKQQQMDFTQKSTEKHTQNLADTPASILTVPSSTSNQSKTNRDGKGLQLLMNEHLKRFDLLQSEMSAYLRGSSDPAKLVLDAMKGFYTSNLTGENLQFDFNLRVIRRSCLILLQELKSFSPQINPQVREEAMELAADWKAKMTVAAENSYEILGFLWLLTAFELTSTYDARELRNLLAIVAQPEDASQLCQALRITDKAPGSSPSFPVKIEESESSPVRHVATSSSPIVQPTATSDARNVLGCLDAHLSGNHSVQKEMSDALQVSLDPAILALTVMQNSLSQYWSEGGEATVRMNIALLKELKKMLPHVGPHVKKDAMDLAGQWKEKMRVNPDNLLQILCFLQFIETYGLLSTFNGDEILKLLGIISQHKQALKLLHTVGFADNIPDFIRTLIRRKQCVEAVRCVCTFKLIDMFPPGLLLDEYVEDARKYYYELWRKGKSLDEKDKVVDNQIADLRAVIQCIKDCNLEVDYPSKDIEMRIIDLERRKANSSGFGRYLTGNGEQQEQVQRKKRSTIVSAPEFQPPEKRQNQSHRTAVASAVALNPTLTRGSPQLSSSQLYENRRHVGQFGMSMAANHHEIGGNFGGTRTQSSSASGLYEQYGGRVGHSSQFGMSMAANYHGFGANSSPIQIKNGGLYLSDPLFPRPNSNDPN